MASQRLPPSLPSRTMSGRYFYGWNVVAATFVMALFSFGLGFYGLSATLQRIHGCRGGRRRSGGRSWDEERSSEKARSVNRAFILSRLTRYGGSEWRTLK